MSDKTKIEWTEATWNPITGCTKVSEGCKNCYAERIAKRFWKGRKFTDVKFHPTRLNQPYHWKKPRMIFVCSMGDLFHEKIEPFQIAFVLDRTRECPHHIFQILTKRTDIAYDHLMNNIMLNQFLRFKNLWLGTSVENQETYDARLPKLILIDSYLKDMIRFVSIEPLLSPIDMMLDYHVSNQVDWVIVGCESGPNARPMELDWVRDIRDQCIKFNVPFFFKQAKINGKLVKMPELDGKIWNQYPAKHAQGVRENE